MKTLMIIAALALLVLPAGALAGGGTGAYEWQWSFSSTDATMNTTTGTGLLNIYLHYTGCNAATASPGMTAAEMGLNVTGGWTQLGPMSPLNGFLNASTDATVLQLVVGACEAGPIVAGSLFVNVVSDGKIGMIQNPSTGFALVVDCGAGDGWDHPGSVRYQGAGTVGQVIQDFGNGCAANPVDDASWGNIKGLYR